MVLVQDLVVWGMQNPFFVLLVSVAIAGFWSMDRFRRELPFFPGVYVAGGVLLFGTGFYILADRGLEALIDEFAGAVFFTTVIGFLLGHFDIKRRN